MARVGQGKRWLLLTRWINLSPGQTTGAQLVVCAQPQAIQSFYHSKESLAPALDSTKLGVGAMLSYLERWIDQLRWQRLRPFEKLAAYAHGNTWTAFWNYCRTKVPLGMVEAINGNIKSLLLPRPRV